MDEFRSLLAARSDVPGVRTLLSAALWHQGHRDESAEVAREARAADAELVAALDRGLAESGPAGGMLKLGEAIASRARRGGRGDPLVIAALLARGGDLDHALEWLETGLERRSPMLPLHLAADPDYDPLREHPRYVALLEEVGLPR